MKNNLSQIIPIQNIEKKLLINGNGDVTAGFSLLMPEVFTYDENRANELLTFFENLFSSVQSGITFHFQHFIYNDNYKADFSKAKIFTQIEDLKNFADRPICKHYVNLYVTFPTLNKKAGSAYVSEADYIFKRPFKNYDSNIKTAVESFEKVDLILNNSDLIQHFRMDNDALGSALVDFYNLSYDKPSKDFEEKSLAPFKIEDDCIKIGNQYAKVISLIDEGDLLHNYKVRNTVDPKKVSDIDFNNKIKVNTCLTYPLGIGLPFNHILNISVTVLDKEKAVQEVQAGDMWLTVLSAFGNNEAKAKREDINRYIDLITTQQQTATKISINVIVNDINKDLVSKRSSIVQTEFKNMNNSIAWIENVENANCFFSSFPGNSKTNIRNFFSTHEKATFYMHTVNYYNNDPKGYVIPDRHGNPTVLNFKDNPHKTNTNGIIVGTSGSGKSHNLQGFIDKFINANDDVLLINVKPDYVNSGKMNNCNYIDTNNPDDISLAPFMTPIVDGKYRCNIEDINYLNSLIFDCWKNENEEISKELSTHIDNYIESFYTYVNKDNITPTFTSFYEYSTVYEDSINEEIKKYIDFESFRHVLYEYAHGKTKNLLNGTTEINIIDKQYTVFDFFGVYEIPNIFKIYLNYAVHIGVQKIYKNRDESKFTWIIIDEAVDSMTGKAAQFIGSQFRKIRSLNGAIWLATQGITYFDNVDPLVRQSIFRNADFRILLKPKDNDEIDNKAIQEYLAVTDFGIELMKSLTSSKNYREYVLLIGAEYYKVLRDEVSEKSNIVYETSRKEGSDAVMIEQAFKKFKNPGLAVNNYYEQKKLKVTL